MKRDDGFTLIELLAVIVVIGLLAVLLMPVVSRARQTPLRTTCASNLRQLYVAFAMYADDHDRYLPPYAVTAGGGYYLADGEKIPVPEHAALLVAALSSYTHSSSIWFCPLDPWMHKVGGLGLGVNHLYTSYLFNGNLAAAAAGGTPLSIDGTVTLPDGAAISTPADKMGLATDDLWLEPVSPVYSHIGRFNFLYLDGHLTCSSLHGL